MIKLTKEQKDFLEKHKIDERMIFDATGIRHKDYKIIVKNLGLFFAIGVTPCKKKGHTLRSRQGKCIQCSPADIAFMQRSGKNAYIYVVGSLKGKVLKVGFSKDVNDRLEHLNGDKYGGIDDWKILYKGKYDEALKFENLIHNKLSDVHYNIEYNYFGNNIICNEIFRCNFSKIKNIIDKNKDKFGSGEDEYIFSKEIDKYNFIDEKKIIKNNKIEKKSTKTEKNKTIIKELEEKLENAEQDALAYGNGLDIISEHPVLGPLCDKLLKEEEIDIQKTLDEYNGDSKFKKFKEKSFFVILFILIFLYATGFFQNEANPIKVYEGCNITEYTPNECKNFCNDFKKQEKLIFGNRNLKANLLLPSSEEILKKLKVPAGNCVKATIDKFNNNSIEEQKIVKDSIIEETNFKGLFEFKYSFK